METFSTVLFVNHAPVGYSVVLQESRAELNPAENPGRAQEAPRLVAERTDGSWFVKGTDNEELIRQVQDELVRTHSHPAGNFLSAAP